MKTRSLARASEMLLATMNARQLALALVLAWEERDNFKKQLDDARERDRRQEACNCGIKFWRHDGDCPAKEDR